jgi:ferritin-like metal-binding protein YciE
MSEAATSDVLQNAFEDREYVTQKHARRLGKIFSLLGMAVEEQQCRITDALIQAAEKVIASTKENTMTRDAALIICAQKAEHHEIATYGSLVQVALTLDYPQIADMLEKTLWEEEDTDRLLTEIAESDINPMAD